MAIYNEFERKVITSLVKMDQIPGGINVLGNIWEEYFPTSYIVRLKEETEARIYFRYSALPSDNLAFSDADKHFRTTAYRILKVFERLEKDGLIAFVGTYPAETLGVEASDEQYVAYNLKEHDILDKLRTLACRIILVYPEMHELVKNDFVDEETHRAREEVRKYRRTLTLTIIGLVLTGVGAVATVYEKFFKSGPSKVEITNPTIKVQLPAGASSTPVQTAPAPLVSAPATPPAAAVTTPTATPVPPASPAHSATVPSIVTPSNPSAVAPPVQPVPTAAPAP